jgi:hypothetical protein
MHELPNYTFGKNQSRDQAQGGAIKLLSEQKESVQHAKDEQRL